MTKASSRLPGSRSGAALSDSTNRPLGWTAINQLRSRTSAIGREASSTDPVAGSTRKIRSQGPAPMARPGGCWLLGQLAGAVVHGSGLGHVMRTERPRAGVLTLEVSEAQPVQVRQVSISVTDRPIHLLIDSTGRRGAMEKVIPLNHGRSSGTSTLKLWVWVDSRMGDRPRNLHTLNPRSDRLVIWTPNRFGRRAYRRPCLPPCPGPAAG